MKKISSKRWTPAWLAIFVLTLGVSAGFAQVDTGTILGTVKDQTRRGRSWCQSDDRQPGNGRQHHHPDPIGRHLHRDAAQDRQLSNQRRTCRF